MKFWSNLEKEYDNLFGDGESEKQETPDKNQMESDFNQMFKEIKRDLKKVPKEDLIPGIASVPDGDASESDDGEFDEDDARKASKIGERKKEKGTKCKVGNQSYEVGERWKDPVTGKDMICILMNIPKDVQPRLAQADLTITKDEPTSKTSKFDTSSKTKSGVSQWAYTNKGAKVRNCPSDKESEKPDQVGSEEEKDEDNNPEEHGNNFNDLSPYGSPLMGKEDEIIGKENSVEDMTEKEISNSIESSEKDSMNKDPFGKESDDNSNKTVDGGYKSGRLEENREVDEDSDTGTDSEDEQRVGNQNELKDEEESEYEERDEDRVKHMDRKKDDIHVTTEDRETRVVESTSANERHNSAKKKPKKDAKTTEEANQKTTDLQQSQNPTTSEAVPLIQEKGKTIYTKETTVTQRKLFKTSETIESVETEKNVD